MFDIFDNSIGGYLKVIDLEKVCHSMFLEGVRRFRQKVLPFSVLGAVRRCKTLLG
jgi:hypothetical protein